MTPIPLGFCIEQSSVVTWTPTGFRCECATPHEFRENGDSTWSPVERGDEDPWFRDPGVRRQVYRFAKPSGLLRQVFATDADETR